MNTENIVRAWENISVENKSVVELYKEISAPCMSELIADWKCRNERTVSYLSMEFLIGRVFYNNLMELGLLEKARQIFAAKGFSLTAFEEVDDAALGNGGLGRLAACYLDSAAELGYAVNGYGIRYRFGLFRQSFHNGYQVEADDDWLKYGDPWSVRRDAEARKIKFSDMEVIAVPYDMPIIGQGKIGTLRLYQAEGDSEAQKISEHLYPADDTTEGKILRLRQEYFFSAAAVGELVDRYLKNKGARLDRFWETNAIQLNDTHPVFAIAEFIRILTKEHNISFGIALDTARKTFNYTNHTILSEALECWNCDLLDKILPDISFILKRLQLCALNEWKQMGIAESERAEMSLIRGQNFLMANIAVYIAGKVNGVAELHTQILKKELFATAYKYYPQKFINVTNGVTPRRWLMCCNEELSKFYDKRLNTYWRYELGQISQIDCRDENNLSEFCEVKEIKKKQLAAYIKEREGIDLLPNAIYVAQVKRLHEYKRQLMTAFAILQLYFDLKEGKLPAFTPMVFIFGAKAASGYKRAKAIIKYINDIAELINGDKEINAKLQVVFVQNYDVSYAEKIIPGTDVSLQVSTAGFEASGTGNMKFMMNGAVTVGTMDGANIEIAGEAGTENNYIFGATAQEIAKMRAEYKPSAVLKKYPQLKRTVETLTDGTFGDGEYLVEIYRSIFEQTYNSPDHYFVLYDLAAYVETLLKVNADYGNRTDFLRKQLINAISSSFFSSDRAIETYAKEIWKL